MTTVYMVRRFFPKDEYEPAGWKWLDTSFKSLNKAMSFVKRVSLNTHRFNRYQVIEVNIAKTLHDTGKDGKLK